MSRIDISGLDKLELVKRLWNNTDQLGMGRSHPNELPPDDDIQEQINVGYIDYLRGKPLKITIGDSTMRTDLYNRDSTGKTAESIVAEMRKEMKVS